MQGPDPASLMLRTAQGDCAAFEALYRLYARDVRKMVCRASGGRLNHRRGIADAEDVCQIVFLNVWKNAHWYDPECASVGAWICGVARNAARDFLRANKRRKTEADNPDAAWEFVAPSTPSRVESSDEYAALRDRLDEIPAKQRAILELVYLRGMTRAEVADALGIPVGTVKSQCHFGARKAAVSTLG